MKSLLVLASAVPLIVAAAVAEKPAPSKPALAPSEIVAAAPAADWLRIAPADLLVMDLTPGAKGRVRRVVIQLMPPPFSQGWVGNIRKLVAARWYDGVSVNRVQDNYVVQWGDAAEDEGSKKPLPEGLRAMPESAYTLPYSDGLFAIRWIEGDPVAARHPQYPYATPSPPPPAYADPYSGGFSFVGGFPVGMRLEYRLGTQAPAVIAPVETWPVHCYGMVGVGRNLSPDTGSGAELYTVIGHAPRHLDRNIALVGRVIEGIEHLSSLPRGTEALGFYKMAGERTPIRSVRMGDEVKGLAAYEYLSTESASFLSYADARANRRDAFFNVPAGGADICNVPVPVRRAKG